MSDGPAAVSGAGKGQGAARAHAGGKAQGAKNKTAANVTQLGAELNALDATITRSARSDKLSAQDAAGLREQTQRARELVQSVRNMTALGGVKGRQQDISTALQQAILSVENAKVAVEASRVELAKKDIEVAKYELETARRIAGQRAIEGTFAAVNAGIGAAGTIAEAVA